LAVAEPELCAAYTADDADATYTADDVYTADDACTSEA
jgi:hypothetical protein